MDLDLGAGNFESALAPGKPHDAGWKARVALEALKRQPRHAKIGYLTVELDWMRKNPNNSVCEGMTLAAGKA